MLLTCVVVPRNVVIAGLVPAIHRSAGAIFQDSSTPVEAWITGTSPVKTVVV